MINNKTNKKQSSEKEITHRKAASYQIRHFQIYKTTHMNRTLHY